MLSHPNYLAHIDADAHLLAAAAAKGLNAAVPGCPGWSVAELLDHVSSVYARSADIVEAGLVGEWPLRRVRPNGEDALAWFRVAAHRMAVALADADPAAPAITFATEQTVGFWIRRMAHETLMHRVDAEQAHGYESILDSQLAVDGIAETFEVFITRFPDEGQFIPEDDSIRVIADGTAWTVRIGRFVGSRGGKTLDLLKAVVVSDATPAATIAGDPARLLLWMWGRAPLEDVTVDGPITLAHRFREVCSI